MLQHSKQGRDFRTERLFQKSLRKGLEPGGAAGQIVEAIHRAAVQTGGALSK